MGHIESWKINACVAPLIVSSFLAVSFLGTAAVHGGMVELGSCGWKAEWDDSFDEPVGLVDVVVDACLPGEDIVFIQKVARFIQGPGPGLPRPGCARAQDDLPLPVRLQSS